MDRITPLDSDLISDLSSLLPIDLPERDRILGIVLDTWGKYFQEREIPFEKQRALTRTILHYRRIDKIGNTVCAPKKGWIE